MPKNECHQTNSLKKEQLPHHIETLADFVENTQNTQLESNSRRSSEQQIKQQLSQPKMLYSQQIYLLKKQMGMTRQNFQSMQVGVYGEQTNAGNESQKTKSSSNLYQKDRQGSVFQNSDFLIKENEKKYSFVNATKTGQQEWLVGKWWTREDSETNSQYINKQKSEFQSSRSIKVGIRNFQQSTESAQKQIQDSRDSLSQQKQSSSKSIKTKTNFQPRQTKKPMQSNDISVISLKQKQTQEKLISGLKGNFENQIMNDSNLLQNLVTNSQQKQAYINFESFKYNQAIKQTSFPMIMKNKDKLTFTKRHYQELYEINQDSSRDQTLQFAGENTDARNKSFSIVASGLTSIDSDMQKHTNQLFQKNYNIQFQLGTKPAFDDIQLKIPYQDGPQNLSEQKIFSKNKYLKPEISAKELCQNFYNISGKDSSKKQQRQIIRKASSIAMIETSKPDHFYGETVNKSLVEQKIALNRFLTIIQAKPQLSIKQEIQNQIQKPLQELREELFDLSKRPPPSPTLQFLEDDLTKKKLKISKLSPLERLELAEKRAQNKLEKRKYKMLLKKAQDEAFRDQKEWEEKKVERFEAKVKLAKSKVDKKTFKQFSQKENKKKSSDSKLAKFDQFKINATLSSGGGSTMNFYSESDHQILVTEPMQQIQKAQQPQDVMRRSDISFFGGKIGIVEDNQYLENIVDNALQNHQSRLERKRERQEKAIKQRVITKQKSTDERLNTFMVTGQNNLDQLQRKITNQDLHKNLNVGNVTDFFVQKDKQQLEPLNQNGPAFLYRQNKHKMIKEIISNFASDEDADELVILDWENLESPRKKEAKEKSLHQDRQESSIKTNSSRDGKKIAIQRRVKHAVKQMELTKKITKNADLEQEENKVKAQNVFIDEFQDKQEIMLPLTNKVVDKTLALQGYTLSIGQCTALARVFKEGHLTLKTLFLDNCGVDDDECACLLDGLVDSQEFQTFYYKNNVFGFESLHVIGQIFQKPRANSLLQLRLVKCQTPPSIISELLTRVAGDAIYLRSLGIIQMGLNELQLDEISRILTINSFLDDLDLSWNGLIAKDFKQFIKSIGKNRNLQSLNLSWNQIIDLSDQNKPGDYQKALQDKNDSNLTALEKLKLRQAELNETSDHPQLVSKCIEQLVRFNTRLQHLDLTHTGLSEAVIVAIVPGLQRAKSLLSLHLDINPGINQKVIDFYQQQLKCQLMEERQKIKFKRYKQQDFENQSKSAISEDLCIAVNKISALKIAQQKQENIEAVSLQSVKNKQKLYTYQDLNLDGGQVFGITRILGHKQEMPGVGQWNFLKSQDDPCWVCDFWNYCLVFWNEEIGNFNEQSGLQIGQNEKQRIINILRRENEQDFFQNPNRPVLFTESTNWKGRPFFRLLDYIYFTLKPPDFSKEIQNRVQNEIRFNPTDCADPEYITRFSEKYAQEKFTRWENDLCANWIEAIRSNQRQKHPHLINLRKVINPRTTFVLPIFLKPARNHFIIRGSQRMEFVQSYQTTMVDDFPVYYNRHIVDVRQHGIQQFAKVLAKATQERQFNLQSSIFRSWKLDDTKVIRECLRHDRHYWKINRFVKDEDDLKLIESAIEYNFLMIKEIFTVYAAHGKTLSTIDNIGFYNFCVQADIIDKFLTREILDMFFIATNVEIDGDQDQNDDVTLVRFEFIEILMRICRGRYLDNGECQTFNESFTILLETKLSPLHEKIKSGELKIMNSSHHWREKTFWTLEISDMLESNMEGINVIYKQLQRMGNKKHANRNDLINFITVNCSKLTMSLKQITTCFALSKMTVIQENDVGLYEYNHLRQIEFVEFIGRLAQEKFRDTPQHNEWTLQKKLEPILDILLKVVNQQRVNPGEVNLIESDVDDDY